MCTYILYHSNSDLVSFRPHTAGSAEARQYVDRLLSDGRDVACDEGFNTYVQELPEWYDDVKYKRYVIHTPKETRTANRLIVK